MKTSATVIFVGVAFSLLVSSCRAGNVTDPCRSDTSRAALRCGQNLYFSDKFDLKDRALVEGITADLTSIVLDKDTSGLIEHENANDSKDDKLSFPKDKQMFLFGDSEYSVRKILLQREKPSVYVEPHDIWGSIKGKLYLLVFFDASKISIDKIAHDIGGDRKYYQKYYTACLVQSTDKNWLMPETPFFWETDGP